jgi:hypothetical protein
VDYLIEENHWKKKGEKINAEEFEFKGSREKLIQHIEEKGLEKDLREIVSDAWTAIRVACRLTRKVKYE